MSTRMKILAWVGGITAAITLIILLNVNWSKITTWWSNSILPILPVPLGWAMFGIVVVPTVAYVLYKWTPTWVTTVRGWSLKGVFRLLSVIAAILWILHVWAVHNRLSHALFEAWFFSVNNLAIGMSILGVLLASWLFSDGTRVIPVRKVLGFVVLGFIAFILVDFCFPNAPWKLIWRLNKIPVLVLGAGLALIIFLLFQSWGRSFLGWTLKLVLVLGLTGAVVMGIITYGRHLNRMNEVNTPIWVEASAKPINATLTSHRRHAFQYPKSGWNWVVNIYGPQEVGGRRDFVITIEKSGHTAKLAPDDMENYVRTLPLNKDPIFLSVEPPPGVRSMSYDVVVTFTQSTASRQ